MLGLHRFLKFYRERTRGLRTKTENIMSRLTSLTDIKNFKTQQKKEYDEQSKINCSITM